MHVCMSRISVSCLDIPQALYDIVGFIPHVNCNPARFSAFGTKTVISGTRSKKVTLSRSTICRNSYIFLRETENSCQSWIFLYDIVRLRVSGQRRATERNTNRNSQPNTEQEHAPRAHQTAIPLQSVPNCHNFRHALPARK